MSDPIDLPRSEQTRSAILAAAFELFSRQGYHGTSMRQIAEAAGVALGGIYHHFANKEQIFVQVLAVHHPIYEVLPHLKAAQGQTLEQLVRDAAQRLARRFEERLDFLNLMFIEVVEFESRHLDELFKIIYPQVVGFGQELQTWQDELKPIPIPILLRLFISFFFAYVISEYLIGKHFPPEMRQDALEHSVQIFLYGITKGKDHELPPELDHP